MLAIIDAHPQVCRHAESRRTKGEFSPLGSRAAVSWPWVLAWGSLEPSRRGGENAQKTGKNGGKMGEIRPKTCEGRELTKDQLAWWRCRASHTVYHGRAAYEDADGAERAGLRPCLLYTSPSPRDRG